MPLYSSDPNPAADAEKARAEERRREEQEAKERERRRMRRENRLVEEGARARQLQLSQVPSLVAVRRLPHMGAAGPRRRPEPCGKCEAL